MIEKLMSLNHFTYKKPFSGSDNGNKFHYIIRMIEEEVEPKEDATLAPTEGESEKKPEKIRLFLVTCWRGDYNSLTTPDEDKIVKKYPFTEEGYDEALKWLNEESAIS